MTYDALQKSIKDKKYHPVYFLHGEEPFYIDKISELIESNVLNSAEQAFNQVILYGKDVDFKSVIDEARQFPMMSPYRVIIIREAQEMKTLAELITYMEKPSLSTVLVICHKYKKIDKRTKFAKILEEKAITFESKKLYDNQIPPWITEYLRRKGIIAEKGVEDMLAEYLGSDLNKISNELEKLLLNMTQGQKLTLNDVREQIGISKDFDVFELNKTLGNKDFAKANRMINYFAENPTVNPVPMIVANLFSYFNKVFLVQVNQMKNDQELSRMTGISPFFMKEYRVAANNYSTQHLIRIFGILKKCDQASKGIGYRRNDNLAVLQDFLICCMA
jgi:DNA polymerase-3 subunit delta